MNVGTKQSAVAFLEPSTGIPGIFNATAAHTHTHTHWVSMFYGDFP